MFSVLEINYYLLQSKRGLIIRVIILLYINENITIRKNFSN